MENQEDLDYTPDLITLEDEAGVEIIATIVCDRKSQK